MHNVLIVLNPNFKNKIFLKKQGIKQVQFVQRNRIVLYQFSWLVKLKYLRIF